MKSLIFFVALHFLFLSVGDCLYQGPFLHSNWYANLNSNSTESDKSLEMSVLIGLVVDQRDQLDDLLVKVSNPHSSEYGKYLNADDISKISSPDEEMIGKLLQWLEQSEGTILINKSKDMVNLKGTINRLEKLFSTNLEWHAHSNALVPEKYLRATQNISVPEDLQDIISFISINSPIITKQRKRYSPQSGATKHHTIFSEFATELTPAPGNLLVSGRENSAILGFSLYCWSEEKKSPLCDANLLPSFLVAQVTQEDTSFPAMHFQVPFDSLTCVNISAHQEEPCDPLNKTATSCTCGFLVGPLPKYSQLSFSVGAVGTSAIEPTPIASSPSPVELLDIVTPTLLRDIYNIPELTLKHGATVAVAEFLDQFYNNDDLKKFFHLTGLNKENIPSTDVFGNKPDNPSYPGGEAMLDIEYLMALAPNSSLAYYSTGFCDPFCGASEDFLLWLFFIGCQDEPEMVHSISYGDSENSDHNTSVSSEFFNRIDVEFLKLGLQGVTVVFSSGDDGVCDIPTPANPKGCAKAQPTWPSSSPYVTSVGATQLSDKYLPACGTKWSETFGMELQCTGVGEVVCQADKGGIITPGGGFSNVYHRPWWQDHAVSEFLKDGYDTGAYPTDPGFFNIAGRAYPDVSVHGALYLVVTNGSMVAESGTSCSAPMFSALITLANDLRLGEGLPPLGFVNPLLYHLKVTNPEVFNDITVGNNACRAGHLGGPNPIDCNDKYFVATPGWDPVSGLGSIDFESFSEAVLQIGAQESAPEEMRYFNQQSSTNSNEGSSSAFNKAEFSFLIPMMVSFLALGVSIHANLNSKKENSFNRMPKNQRKNKGWSILPQNSRCASAPSMCIRSEGSNIQYGSTKNADKKGESSLKIIY
mmetsp:Transcript_5879/g.8066  ORF Transcript_5879/g.8066 Transcript_5879/m.8066 type:complete len:871 (-) Transcript_5879:124-2736(-)|eukprot:CAMPEP_0117753772 /NCGR_PEP_ID=MMETSP0947-20121206/12431_1 /TAXON_ID=44440 /ORGANISM="Chattonella subsalsa, Strain CCMP2191" /LENGTH=870 /DNA_ID=CAMNT_0005572731 /DNA_START=121 /DNA_END=2733 /DNA_ORIENTATION=-